ncbi:uncharacterized protein LOC127860275 [Dreissena polymorpha]|uniref:uncharacterized protein LOC127860275 n=1 Tax=Dreissena polymorpha TaxID=45954 RepID=UPI002263D227|nr:uncharacterized protein LOC127860275 [Dreissena polymorpha]
MLTCTVSKMQLSAVILLFIPHLLDANFTIKPPRNIDACVESDTKLSWKSDSPSQILTIFYEVKVPGASTSASILAYNGANAFVINNYNVRWDNETGPGPITIVNTNLNNTGDYSIEVTYSGQAAALDVVSMLVLDPPKKLGFKKNNLVFTCQLDYLGTPSVSLYAKVDDVPQSASTITALPFNKVECCISGAAVSCMPESPKSPHCILAQEKKSFWEWLYDVAVGLISYMGVQVVCINIAATLIICCVLIALLSVWVWLMRIVNFANYVAVVWSAIMVGLVYGLDDCTDKCAVIAIVSLVQSGITAILKICLIIYCCFAEPKPGTFAEKLKRYGNSLRKLHCCSPMDQDELRDVALFHAYGTIIGFIIVFVFLYWIGKPGSQRKPGPVRNLKGSPQKKKINVEWTPPEDTGDDPESLYYRVSCEEEGYDKPPGISKETLETKLTFDKLTPRTKYVVTVYAINSVGESQPNTIHIMTKQEQDPGKRSHGQGTGHSNTGEDKRVGASKQKDTVSTPTGNASKQPRDSGAVSRTDIELTEGNFDQDKPMLRPQPKLPGIVKSHQQVDESHHKNTRGLSSNFDDPNSVTQLEVLKKKGLDPISATDQSDSNSQGRQTKEKKKKERDASTSGEDKHQYT